MTLISYNFPPFHECLEINMRVSKYTESVSNSAGGSLELGGEGVTQVFPVVTALGTPQVSHVTSGEPGQKHSRAAVDCVSLVHKSLNKSDTVHSPSKCSMSICALLHEYILALTYSLPEREADP